MEKPVTKIQSRTITLSEKRSDSGCEICQLKSNQDIRLRVHHKMFVQRWRQWTRRGKEMLVLAVLHVVSKCVCLSPSCQHLLLGNVNPGVSIQCHITPNFQDAFMWRGHFVFSSSVCRVLYPHAVVFCYHARYWLICVQLQQDLFSHKRKRQVMYPHLWASSMCSSRRHLDVTVRFCIYVCITLAGLVQFHGCVCIHHSENMCVLNVFVYLWFPHPFLSFSL